MELRHLRYFIAVAETGSLTEAAERRLYTSQPSLSRQIRDLESHVGVQLLSRSVRGVELTPAGKAFLDHARLVLMHADDRARRRTVKGQTAARRAKASSYRRTNLFHAEGPELRSVSDREVLVDGAHGRRSFSDGCGDSLGRAGTDVADGEEPRTARLERKRLPCQCVPSCIEVLLAQ